MADEISETKTRYERLDPNVVKVFRLAELANKDNEDCHLGELLKFSEDTAMTILMALDCEDNLPPLTEADLLAFVDVQEPDISAPTADIRASVVKKFATAVANLDGSAVQYASACARLGCLCVSRCSQPARSTSVVCVLVYTCRK